MTTYIKYPINPIKIFYIANARMPSEKAHGIQLAKMCEALIEQGADLTLVVPAVGRRFSGKHPVLRRTQPQFLQNTAAGDGKHRMLRKKVSENLLRDYYGLRVDIPIVRLPVLTVSPSTSWGFTLRALSFALSSFLYVLLQRLRFGRAGALVYTIDMDQFSYFLLPLAGLAVFFEVHGGKRASAALRFFLRRVRGIITNSGGTRDALVRNFALKDTRIIVEPNGVDMEHFAALPSSEEARRALGLAPDAQIALYVGRFYEWKGLDILVEAAERLPSVEFLLVGGTAEEFLRVAPRHSTSTYTQGILDVGGHEPPDVSMLPKNFRCVGSKPPQGIPLWIAAADVLLVLGTQKNEYSYRETSPMKLFEYMAARRPIVASATPANFEIVSAEEAALYEPDDAASLVRAISRVLDDPANALSRIERAAVNVARWTWSRRVERILRFLSRV